MLRFFLLICFIPLLGHANYVRSPFVSEEIWNEVSPYFLPYKHPLRKKLDNIFTRSRVTENNESMQAAGFSLTETQGQRVVTTKHPSLKGYVIKMYLEDRETREDWISWKDRITGAKLLKKQIKKLDYGHLFKVAKKWIYPLPLEPGLEEKPGYHRKNFILVVEDMRILKHKDNSKTWRNLRDSGTLKKLVDITRPLGARDCARACNIPWSKDGRIAFVDTETYHTWPINYHGLLQHLNKEMRVFWEQYYPDKCYPEN